ncbi:Cytochrome P450 4c3 [Operophtera brumata]|uniref:Cytochrome P450 4c3 n=1 Tax=Operophtera brumata TaxID=104452 RepID=A0A0L7KXB7_OPEBR|nr:Cytochrome P450 4c3 [Operophtera brumata]
MGSWTSSTFKLGNFLRIWMRKRELLASYADAVEEILNVVIKRGQKIWLHNDFLYSLTELRRREDQALRVIHRLKSKALLDLLLELSEDEALTDREIREEIDTTFAAALDSTAWVLTDVNKYDLSKLVYLEAVIKESLRLYTTGPITLRTLDKDIKLNREQYNPERWLEPETNGFVFAGFSLGRRTCIGKTYAMMSLKTVLSHLLRRYKVTANVNDLELKFEFILKPSSGHFVSIERRC